MCVCDFIYNCLQLFHLKSSFAILELHPAPTVFAIPHFIVSSCVSLYLLLAIACCSCGIGHLDFDLFGLWGAVNACVDCFNDGIFCRYVFKKKLKGLFKHEWNKRLIIQFN